MASSSRHCVGCGSGRLCALDNRTIPRGVASDCKPWPRCGEFVICEDCGHTQKIQDATWQKDVANIYGGYEVYFLSGGNEQVVFDGFQPLPRTKRLIDVLRQRVALPATGRMLDVGCANGSTLRTFSSLFPRWQLAGFDINTHSETMVKAIPGVTDFFTGSLDAIDRKFDFITMLYVVEHLPEPRQVLEQFHRLLNPGGTIWVHTSDFWANPFDLTVVDHSSHFMVDTLAELVERCGFEVFDRNDDWNIKEMGVVGRLPKSTLTAAVDQTKKRERLTGTPRRMRWLGEVVEQACKAAGRGKFGVFGTAIAGTWLANMAPEHAGFFVDEDKQRTGKTHMGLPVVPPDEVPANAPIYLAFPTFQAEKIQTRLAGKYPNLNFVVPPPVAA
jgi:SAM-dependent methyltransferase